MAVSLVSTGVTFPDNSTQNTAATGFGFKNRIINGAMVIDQRNAGASLTVNSGSDFYAVDRFSALGAVADGVFTVQQVTDAPSGFKNSVKITVTTADASIGSTQRYLFRQTIEGNNVADLGFGGASASSVTVSFRVKSSVTGTFSGSLQNSAQDRAYPFNFSISSANTWEEKSVTIAGDTSGTWLTDNGAGLRLNFDLGCGSSYRAASGAWAAQIAYGATGSVQLISTVSATFYITGVQLEKGSTATSFDYRPYGTELALCQRYYYKNFPAAVNKTFCMSFNGTTVLAYGYLQFPVSMRTSPTALEQNGTANNYMMAYLGTSTACSAVPAFVTASPDGATISATVASGLTAGQGSQIRTDATNGATAYLGWSAEL